MSLRLSLPGPADTDALGAALARALPAEPVVAWLRGELGAGKSSLARALLRELGVEGAIRSPTYTLIERYSPHGGDVLHLDLYRIAAAGELEFLGLDDLRGEARLWLVEWPERGASTLPAPDLEIRLALAGGGRAAELQESSEKGRAWLAALSKMAGSGASV
ncbi:MAG: tRNA (adenosine(37)-N6)-threonylcarbamoyltransferase complex ATPase subunit type 1 TsaE [Arenimonas sp.]